MNEIINNVVLILFCITFAVFVVLFLIRAIGPRGGRNSESGMCGGDVLSGDSESNGHSHSDSHRHCGSCGDSGGGHHG